jgi:hypothetical protein
MAKIEGRPPPSLPLGTRWPTSAWSSPSLGNEPRLFPSLGDLEFLDRLFDRVSLIRRPELGDNIGRVLRSSSTIFEQTLAWLPR